MWFKSIIIIRLNLDTTYLLWRPSKMLTLHKEKVQYNHIFQNLTSTGKGPIQANHTKSMMTLNFIFLNDKQNYFTWHTFLKSNANFKTKGVMIFQKIIQGVSKFRSIVEVWTIDGKWYHIWYGTFWEISFI
jgi:hypothetical protein